MGRRTRAAARARQSGAGRQKARAYTWQQAGEGAKLGALAGALFAGLALLVGLVRFALAWLPERNTLATGAWQEALPFVAYVAVFVLGGAAVGAIHRVWGNRLLTAVAFMAIGAALMNTIAITTDPASYSRGDAVAMTALGIFFGLAGAYGVSRQP